MSKGGGERARQFNRQKVGLNENPPDKQVDSIYTVRKFLADFAVQYVTDDAIAKLYVT